MTIAPDPLPGGGFAPVPPAAALIVFVVLIAAGGRLRRATAALHAEPGRRVDALYVLWTNGFR